MSASAEPQLFGQLVQHDRPEEGGDVTNSRKRKEPHAVSSDHWMLMFRHNDYQRRRQVAWTMIQRPDVPRDRLRQPPELHKAINGMSYAQRHAATDIDPLFHAQGPAYFTSYDEDAGRNSQGVGALVNFTQYPAYYGGGDGTQVRFPPPTRQSQHSPTGPCSCNVREGREHRRRWHGNASNTTGSSSYLWARKAPESIAMWL